MTQAEVTLAGAGMSLNSPITVTAEVHADGSIMETAPAAKKKKTNSVKAKAVKASTSKSQNNSETNQMDLTAMIVAALSSGPVLNSLTEVVMSRCQAGLSGNATEPPRNAISGSVPVVGSQGSSETGYVVTPLDTPSVHPQLLSTDTRAEVISQQEQVRGSREADVGGDFLRPPPHITTARWRTVCTSPT